MGPPVKTIWKGRRTVMGGATPATEWYFFKYPSKTTDFFKELSSGKFFAMLRDLSFPTEVFSNCHIV